MKETTCRAFFCLTALHVTPLSRKGVAVKVA